MKSFTYGLSYTIFSSHLNFTAEDIKVDNRYATFTDGNSPFFGPKLLANAQEFFKIEPIDPELVKPLKTDVPILVLNGEMDHMLPVNYITRAGTVQLKGGRSICP